MKKIRIYVLLTVTLTMLVLLLLTFFVCQYSMRAENHVRYVGIMNVVSEKIAKTINGMEMNAMNVFDEVEKNMGSPEAVVDALMSKTSLNLDVRGYFAAFEPDYFPQKGRWFEPYVHQTDSSNTFVMSQVGSARHDYTKSDWYMRAKEESMSFWSDPYYYYDGTSISGHYCTFVEPIFDSNGKLVCVCGADMTLEWLSKELRQIDYRSQQNVLLNKYAINKELDYYTVVVNSDGSCIAHPEDKNVPMKEVVNDLKQRRSGMLETTVNGEPVTIYYGPINNISWSVAVVVPQQDTLKPMLILGLILIAVAMLGLMVVWLVLRSARYAEVS